MPKPFYENSVAGFLADDPHDIERRLLHLLAQRFSGRFKETIDSWGEGLRILRSAFRYAEVVSSSALQWRVALEYPLPRLEKRIDAVIATNDGIIVLELKAGSATFDGAAIAQAEDYALDLHDFHAASRDAWILPVLVATRAPQSILPSALNGDPGVLPVARCNADNLGTLFELIARSVKEAETGRVDVDSWADGPYRPTPSILEAAEILYAGHDVREITHASAGVTNLSQTTDAVFAVVENMRRESGLAVCFITGVPGSGKTLAGLNAVHDRRLRSPGVQGAYLSGNRPLVEVLRKALIADQVRREGGPKREAERAVKAEIQLLMGYLEEYMPKKSAQSIAKTKADEPPIENLIVFDEAQRAWDADFGWKKFERSSSEPALFLEIMARRKDWAVIVALVGSGQEINSGEAGLEEWGKALEEWRASNQSRPWYAYVAPSALRSANPLRGLLSQDGDQSFPVRTDDRLHLATSVRSHRAEALSEWVDAVLEGDVKRAQTIAVGCRDFPILLSRSLAQTREWLLAETRGYRRCGLIASSGARRLRAEGLGVAMRSSDLEEVSHWFLAPRGDIRASFALEVTASEYTCQGLELDYTGVCWGGDLVYDARKGGWTYRRLSGSKWQAIRKLREQEYTRNKYRVLMTRARNSSVIWVPKGSSNDSTRNPQHFDQTAEFLIACGAGALRSNSFPLSAHSSAPGTG